MAGDRNDDRDDGSGERSAERAQAGDDRTRAPALPLAAAVVRLGGMSSDPSKDRALVATRPMIARGLDQAAKGQLVYVGRDGEVKDPDRVRNRQVAWYVAFGGLMAVGVTLAATSLPMMIPFYAALCGRLVGQVRAVKRVNQASAALSSGDTTTARALAEPVSRAWWAPGRVRTLAELRVAFADALEGRGEQALERLRQARARLSPRLVQYQFSYYTEINLLIALGRIKEARALLDSRGGVPTGEVLRFSHWIAEMHLGVAEGKLDLDETELHDRRRKGLSMTTGRDLLLLCAWAYAQRGEHDEAAFAWRQALEREGSPRIEVTMPALVAWMTEYLREHPELEQPEPDDEL
ncbi:MAG TPA: tetratricopeptide repeat protein [Kofleriaceae bacterium]|nr:tetratricopeptide repeat protein [Kofleriaceae bacterium]